jgi:dTDP-4-dehydrorhamnose 3,5-epimerase
MVGVHLMAKDKRQLYIPPGFTHGFCTPTETVLFAYKCSHTIYHPESELSMRWDDLSIGIDWPIADPVLSGKDAAAQLLADVDPKGLPVYAGEP